MGAARVAVERREKRHLGNRFVDVVAEKPGHPVNHDFGDRAHPRAEHGRAAGHRLDEGETESLRARRHVNQCERV